MPNSELLILIGSSPLYSMKPSFLNWFRKKFTRERVVPTISASVSWHHAHWYSLLPVARQQKQCARQPFLAEVEKLIDQVLFDSDAAGQHLRDESIGHGALPVQQLRHPSLGDAQDSARRDRRGETVHGATGARHEVGQNIPSCSFAASDIRSLPQGGSQTMSTCASVMPGSCFSLLTTSTGRL